MKLNGQMRRAKLLKAQVVLMSVRQSSGDASVSFARSEHLAEIVSR